MITKVNKRYSNESLVEIIKNLKYINAKDYILYGRFPKISYEKEKRILKKIFSIKTKIKDLICEDGDNVYYRTSGGRYYKVITTFPTNSTKENYFCVKPNMCKITASVLSSNLYFWFYHIYSNNLDLKSYEIEAFSIPIEDLFRVREIIESIFEQYLSDILKNSKIKKANYKNVKEFREFYVRKSKHIIDQIDCIICPLYGLTPTKLNLE